MHPPRNSSRRQHNDANAGGHQTIQINIHMQIPNAGKAMWHRVTRTGQGCSQGAFPSGGFQYKPAHRAENGVQLSPTIEDMCGCESIRFKPCTNAAAQDYRLDFNNLQPPTILRPEMIKRIHIDTISHMATQCPRAPATMHNICGKIAIAYDKEFDDMLQDVKGSTRGDRQDGFGHVVQHSNTQFGACAEIFTSNGTATMRQQRYCTNGQTITFKGVKDVQRFVDSMQAVIGEQTWARICPTPKPMIHMAVTTLSTGRKIDVAQDCLLTWGMCKLLPRGSIKVSVVNNEEISAAAFTIVEWKSIYEVTGNGEPPANATDCKASATVTGKGSIIIRMSWERPVEWDRGLHDTVLLNSKVIGDAVSRCI